MSKIGKQPIVLPQGVSVEINGLAVKITGPRGEINKSLPKGIEASVKDGVLTVEMKKPNLKALYGTSRSLLASAVKGVSEGWSKQLELVGTGYRAEISGDTLVLTVGYSHPVKIKAPEGISFTVEKTLVTVSGADKEAVGQVSADIRSARPPEPYKGKGIKYVDEVIRRKAGKAAKTAGAVAA